MSASDSVAARATVGVGAGTWPAIAALTTIEQFAACVDLQRVVWSWSELDIMPVRLFVAIHHAGGVVLGAYDRDALVGFLNGLPGVRDGRSYWYSHMLAVLPAYQDRGIGTALKLAQRQCALERGVGTVRWVFDPLQAKNAYVNLSKLGAIVRCYSVNHYGVSSSPLHAGFDSDRLVAEWRIADPPPRLGGEMRRIRIPADVQRLKRCQPGAARSLQLEVRAAFLEYLAEGFVVTAFERDRDFGTYVLRRDLDADGRGTIAGG